MSPVHKRTAKQKSTLCSHPAIFREWAGSPKPWEGSEAQQQRFSAARRPQFDNSVIQFVMLLLPLDLLIRVLQLP
jgi:hypothetical protein